MPPASAPWVAVDLGVLLEVSGVRQAEGDATMIPGRSCGRDPARQVPGISELKETPGHCPGPSVPHPGSRSVRCPVLESLLRGQKRVLAAVGCQSESPMLGAGRLPPTLVLPRTSFRIHPSLMRGEPPCLCGPE